MSQGKNISRRDRSGARPNHHISSIAHLFFDNNGDESGANSSISSMHLMVVGTGNDTSAPYTAVGLGQHLLDQSATLAERGASGSNMPIRQVFFAESSPVCFSGISQLQAGSFRAPVAGEHVPWANRKNNQNQIFRLFPADVPSEDFSGGMVEGHFFIRHLDLPSQQELNALEVQLTSSQNTGLGDDGCDGIVWCVQGAAGLSLTLMTRLGRLLNVVKPQRIYLLLYPDGGRGRSGSFQETTRALLDRSCRLVELVSGGLQVNGILMGNSPEERTIQLASLSRQLSL